MRWDKLIFVFTTSVLLVGIMAVQHQLNLQQKYRQEMFEQIDDLEQIYNQTRQELELTEKQNRQLANQLQETLDKVEAVEQINKKLEQVLFNQQQTYRSAVSMQGYSMPVLTISSFTANQYERAWNYLRAHGLKGTGETLEQAEKTYGVNSLVLASIAYLESGGGNSRLAREKNNLFGLGAGGCDPFYNALCFDNKEESVYFAARLLSTNYLSREGRFYRGNTLEAIAIRYAEDPEWPYKVARTMAIIARAAIPEGR